MFTGRKPGSFKLWVPRELLLPACVSSGRQDGRPLSLLGSGPPLDGSSSRRALWSWPGGFQKVGRPGMSFAPLASGRRKAGRPDVLTLAWEPCPPGLCFCTWVTLPLWGGGHPRNGGPSLLRLPSPDEEGPHGRCVSSPDPFFMLSLALHGVGFFVAFQVIVSILYLNLTLWLWTH